MNEGRPNVELAQIVDHALTMGDVRTAAAFLVEHGAGFALICRVLGKSARYRAATTEAPAAPEPRARLPSA